MNVNAQKLQSQKNCEETIDPEQPSDDTPSVTPFGRDSSLREGAGGAFSIQPGTCETGRLRAIFIAPTKTQKILVFTIHRGTLPQSASLPAPSGREPGGFFHSTGYSLKSGVTGDFHRPYETLKILVFTVHRGVFCCAAEKTCAGGRNVVL